MRNYQEAKKFLQNYLSNLKSGRSNYITLNEWINWIWRTEYIRISSEKKKETFDLLNEVGAVFLNRNKDEINIKDIYGNEEIQIFSKFESKSVPMESNTFNDKVEKGASAKIEISDEIKGWKPYPHQEKAITALNNYFNKNETFKGLLVLPTGGGKTATAVHWALVNFINKNGKVIWIAHRHELLEQVKRELGKHSSSVVLTKGTPIFYQVVSGHNNHLNPSLIRDDANFLIASKDSLRNENGTYYLMKNYLGDKKSVLLVIDEAHHASAPSYRKLITAVEQNAKSFTLLGLTATPYRTSEKEKGYLEKVFKDNIIYSIHSSDLIAKGILAKPEIIEIPTKLNKGLDGDYELNKDEFDFLQRRKDIPSDLALRIAKNFTRQNLIIKHFNENKDKYGKTIFFAIDQWHAIELNELLKHKGFKSDFVISGTTSRLGIDYDSAKNPEKIEKFRNGDLEALVNVNILTEGTDIPDARTVFLTRPTTSKILMTQMIGRVLRGPKSGGEEKAYVVSFIDNWGDLISWTSPKELFLDEQLGEFEDPNNEYRKIQKEYVRIDLFQKFISAFENVSNGRKLSAIKFINRLPIGWYSFETENIIPSESDASNKNPNDIVTDLIKNRIMVFEHQTVLFDELNQTIESIYGKYDINNDGILDSLELNSMSNHIWEEFFKDEEIQAFHIPKHAIEAYVRYYEQKEKKLPPFYLFEDREKYDIDTVAKYIYDNDLGSLGKKEYIQRIWKENKMWEELFEDFEWFSKEVSNAIHYLEYPEQVKQIERAGEEKMKISLAKKSLNEWPEIQKEKIKSQIFSKYTNEKGEYECAVSGYSSNKKVDFEIDHIIPLSKGGETTLDNLRLVTRAENRKKGSKLE